MFHLNLFFDKNIENIYFKSRMDNSILEILNIFLLIPAIKVGYS